MLLEVKDLNTFYGESHVLQGISLNVAKGELVALLGRNGMGKSTTLKTIMGLVKSKSGSVIFEGSEITGFPPFKAAQAGLGYVPEERRIFPELSVHDNLLLGIKGGKIKTPTIPTCGRRIASMVTFRSSGNAAIPRGGSCPEASSRCCRSAAP